jgi:hypothetical protein
MEKNKNKFTLPLDFMTKFVLSIIFIMFYFVFNRRMWIW